MKLNITKGLILIGAIALSSCSTQSKLASAQTDQHDDVYFSNAKAGDAVVYATKVDSYRHDNYATADYGDDYYTYDSYAARINRFYSAPCTLSYYDNLYYGALNPYYSGLSVGIGVGYGIGYGYSPYGYNPYYGYSPYGYGYNPYYGYEPYSPYGYGAIYGYGLSPYGNVYSYYNSTPRPYRGTYIPNASTPYGSNYYPNTSRPTRTSTVNPNNGNTVTTARPQPVQQTRPQPVYQPQPVQQSYGGGGSSSGSSSGGGGGARPVRP